jgi:hypothetical protein
MCNLLSFDPSFDWSTVVQFFGFAGAIWAVVYQFKKQRELQATSNKSKLEIETYEKVVENIEGGSPTGVAATLRMLIAGLRIARDNRAEFGFYTPPPFEVERINQNFNTVQSELWKVIGTLEKYEIIMPHLPLFREALAVKAQDLTDSYLPIIQLLPYFLLSDQGISDPAKLMVLEGELEERMESLIEAFEADANDVAGFLKDIQVELQNKLLGPYFEAKLNPREPEDSSYLVLTSQDSKMTERIRTYIDESNARRLRPNKGFNRTPESTAPDKPGGPGGGAG